jgi:cyclic pyranopterin phosphate synthase
VTAPVGVPVSVRPHRPTDNGNGNGNGNAVGAVMPLDGPLVDRYGRVHSDLRISVTDRCNLRCTYCMPEEGMTFLHRDDLLTFDEISRVAKVAWNLGITALRLTGGEPLVRQGLPSLIERLAEIGFEDLAMTTNGTGLARSAQRLARAGLRRVNVSCDSLQPERFATIRRRGILAVVLDAMTAAEAAGLTPLKVNVVLRHGQNDDEVLDFASFARTTGRIVRFIEFMPLDAQGEWDRAQLVPGSEVFERISAVWPLEPLSDPTGAAPAERFRFADGRGEIGLISSVTQPFCGTCNRLRLTAEGSLRNCLFSDDELSVRRVLRDGGSDSDVALMFREAVWAKFPGHGINEPGFLRPARSMSMIGG